MSILSTSQFAELDHDPNAYIEGKVQRTLRKIKSKLPSSVYSKIYPTGSLPGKFYGTAKIHKFQTIAQLSTYHLDQSSLISERQPTI